ncbi:DNA cytosine methyltransferase [Haematospirillum sp. 15-248]|uniref:DNA cytosine methyltransferase n=1 Tax=Haematospirillum sp. 15-248 TaxID=2723107 RepID=UPI00143B135C|nr:DNA cytosine methyltransferase [Haematospirillum sp. 15-248]
MPKALKGGKREARLKVVDLFAGAGGLSCGLEMAGFETQFACGLSVRGSLCGRFIIINPLSTHIGK